MTSKTVKVSNKVYELFMTKYDGSFSERALSIFDKAFPDRVTPNNEKEVKTSKRVTLKEEKELIGVTPEYACTKKCDNCKYREWHDICVGFCHL